MNLKNILSEIRQAQRTNIVWSHLYKIPRIDKLIETESILEIAIGWEEEKKREMLLNFRDLAWGGERLVEIDCSGHWTKVWLKLCHWIVHLK